MVGAILQCRMSSDRFPGKVLLEFPWGSKTPLIQRISDQIKKSSQIKKLIIATSTDSSDDAIFEACKKLDLICFRGDLNDVHQRFVDVNLQHSFDHVVRLTGDNPLVDIPRLDAFIEAHLKDKNDYSFSEGLPLGCNFEVYRTNALQSFNKTTMSKDENEHVTLFFKHYPQQYKCSKIVLELAKEIAHISSARLTVDYPSDYAFWNLVIMMNPNTQTIEEITQVITQHRWLLEINKNNQQLIFN